MGRGLNRDLWNSYKRNKEKSNIFQFFPVLYWNQFYERDRRWICWIANAAILNKAQDAATNKGRAITIKRVSIAENPL